MLENINEKMVQLGYAWVYRKYSKSQKLFGLEQRHARRDGDFGEIKSGTAMGVAQA